MHDIVAFAFSSLLFPFAWLVRDCLELFGWIDNGIWVKGVGERPSDSNGVLAVDEGPY